MRARLKVFAVILTASVCGGLALPAAAQYTGPTNAPSGQSVSTILDKPVDEQAVRLQGNLLRKTGKEKYIFSDGTGEIVAEIDDKDFPKQAVDENTKVEIIGEVDTGLRRPPEIEVDTVRVLP
jgi:uncharacterized protein (TIGR00156 family)